MCIRDRYGAARRAKDCVDNIPNLDQLMSSHVLRTMSLIAALCLSACVGSETNKQSGPVDFAHSISDLNPDEDITYGKLSNGLRYAVRSNSTPTKTATLLMRIDTGSLNETDETRGIAHFLEHMAFNGCLLYTSPSPRDRTRSRMPSSA